MPELWHTSDAEVKTLMSGLEETRRVSFDAWIVMNGQRKKAS